MQSDTATHVTRALSRRRLLGAALGLSALGVAAVLTACSQSRATTAPTQAPSGQATPAAASSQSAATGEPLVVWMSDDWSGQADKFVQYKQMAQDASAEIGIPVDYRAVNWTTLANRTPIVIAADKYTTDIIDLGVWDVFNWARQDKLVPLDDTLSPDFVKQIQPPLLETGKVNGKIYAVIVWPSWVIGFCNKDLFEKARLDPEKGCCRISDRYRSSSRTPRAAMAAADLERSSGSCCRSRPRRSWRLVRSPSSAAWASFSSR
jgi:ABC-type glycerol-3-phosphate transport system substrate-binding protein